MSELIEAAKAGDAARARQILATSPRGGLGGQRGRRNAADGGPLPRTSRISPTKSPTPSSRRVRRSTSSRRRRSAAPRPSMPRSTARARSTAYAYDGWTPLHLAAFFGRREAAERLLGAGAALNAKSTNSLSNTPLHAAVAGGRTDVALLLIQRGAEVNASGRGPAHAAAHRRRERQRGGGRGAPRARRRSARRGRRGQDATVPRRRPQSRGHRRSDQRRAVRGLGSDTGQTRVRPGSGSGDRVRPVSDPCLTRV